MDMMTNPLVRSPYGGNGGNGGGEEMDDLSLLAGGGGNGGNGGGGMSPPTPQPLSRQPAASYPTAIGGSPLTPSTLPPATTTPLSRQQQQPVDDLSLLAGPATPATGAPATTPTTTTGAVPPPPDRGVLGETYAAVAGGAFEGLRTGIQAIRAVTESPYAEEPSTLRKVSEKMEQYLKESPSLQQSTNMGETGRWAFGGLRSTTQSLMFGVPGMIAATAAGPPGWLVAGAGYAAGKGIPFGLAQFRDTVDKGVDHFMRQGMSREAAVNKVLPEAIIQAAAETGFEAISDVLGARFILGKPFTEPAKQAAKVAIRDLTKGGFLRMAGRLAGTAAAEVPTEMATSAVQAQSDIRMGIGNQSAWDAAKETFGPAFAASMMLGGLGHVERGRMQSRMLNTLENHEANLKDRTQVAHEVYRTLLPYDEKVANIWWENAKEAIIRNESITTNEDILNLQERKAQLSSLELKSAFEEKYAQKVDAALKDAKERLGSAREGRDAAEEAWAKYQPTMEAQRQAIVDRVEAAKGGEDFAKVKKAAKKELAALDKEANNLRKAAEDGRKAQAAVEREIAVSHDRLYNMWRPPTMGEEYQAAGGAGIPGGPTVEVRPAGSPLARASQMAADLAKDASARRRKITAERDMTVEQRRQAEAAGKERLAREEEVNNLFAAFDAESRAVAGEAAGAKQAEDEFALDENQQAIVAGLQQQQPTPTPLTTPSITAAPPTGGGAIPTATPNITPATPEQAAVQRQAQEDLAARRMGEQPQYGELQGLGWQMPMEEFVSNAAANGISPQAAEDAYRVGVEKAARNGLPVPPEHLARFPELFDKYARDLQQRHGMDYMSYRPEGSALPFDEGEAFRVLPDNAPPPPTRMPGESEADYAARYEGYFNQYSAPIGTQLNKDKADFMRGRLRYDSLTQRDNVYADKGTLQMIRDSLGPKFFNRRGEGIDQLVMEWNRDRNDDMTANEMFDALERYARQYQEWKAAGRLGRKGELKYSLVEGGAATPATTTIDPGIRDAILATVVRLSDRVAAGLRVAPTFSSLPQALQDQAIADHGPNAADIVRGVQDPATGQHWVIADRLESPYAAQHTMLHEVGHAVKRGVHGSDTGAVFFRGLYEAKKNLMGGYAANYKADTTTPEGRALVAEEWWMDMMAQGRYGGGKFASAWAKYVKMFNNALRTMGFDITVSERELAGWAKAYRDGMFGDTAWAVATPAVEPSPATSTTPTAPPTEAAGTPATGDQRYSLLGPTATNWGSLLGRFSSLYDRKEKAWIDDSQSSLTAGWDTLPTTPIGADVRTVAANTVPLSTVFDHPTLYAAYPELADMQVRRQEMRDPGAVAHYDDDRNLVLLSANVTDPAEIRRIIMHEAAHWVQRKEGWGRGGSPMMDLVLDNYDKVLRAAEKAPRADELVPQMEKLGTVLSSFNSMRDEIRLAKEAYRLRENEVTQLRDAVESQLTTLRAAPSPADAATINKLESLRREYTAELYDTTGATDLGSRQQRLDEAKEAYAAARQPYAGVEFLAYQLLSGEVEARFVADMLNEQEKWGKFNTSLGTLRQEVRALDAAKHAVDVATTAAFAKGWDGVTATPAVADARARYKEAYTALNSSLRTLGAEDGLPIDTPSQRTLLDTILNGSDRQVAAALDIHNPATIGMYTIEDIPPDMAITRFEVEKEVADSGGMTAAVEDGVVDLQRLGEGTGVRYSLVPPATTTSANPLTTAATAARNYRDAATDFLVPIRGAWSDIVSRLLRATVPGAASPQHLQAAETFSTHVGVKNHLQEVMGHRLQAANDYFTRNPKEMWQWASAVMTGKPLTGKLKEYADLVNTMLEEARGYLDAAGVPLEAVRPHYFPGIWTNESIRAFNQALQEEVETGTITPATFDVNTADDATKKRVADRVAALLKARQGVDGDQAMAAFAKRPLSGSESFRRGKVFDDVLVAREFGLVPKSEHVIDIVKMKLDEMYRSAMGANAIREFKDKGEIVPTGRDGRPLDPDTFRPIPDAAPLSPDEWVPVNDRFGTIWYRNNRGELVKRGQYLSRIPTADILNNYLSTPIYSNPTFGRLFRIYRGVADALNQFQLGVGSMFHAGFTTGETVVSGLANNIKDVYKWRNGEIDGAEVMRGVTHTLTSPYSNPKQGSEYLKAYLNGEGGKFAMDVVRAVELVGAKTQLDFDLRTQQLEEMKRDWYSDKKLKAIMRSPVAFTEYIARPIMTHLVPRQKLGVFGELVRRIQRDNPGVALENLVPELRKAWNRVDSRLGQVVYDRIYAHNVAKNAVQALMRAPGWTFGTIAEVGGSVKDTKDFFKEWAKTGKAPANIPDRVAYTVSLVVVSAAINAALTYMFTGEPPEGMDYWSFRTGDKDEYGRAERFMLPTYAKDLVAYWRHPTSTLSHKIHPLLSVINEAVIQNKDYYGVEVRNPGDNPIKQFADVAKFGIKQFIPFWMRGVGKEVEREGGEGIGGAFNLLTTRPAKTVAPLIGIMPAPAEYNKSAAERLMTQIGAEERASGAITQKEREHFDLKRRIRHDYMVGKEREAEARLQGAIQQGLLSKREINQLRKTRGETPTSYVFKRLNAEDALRVWSVMTPDERKAASGELMVKMRSVLKNSSPAKRSELLPQFKEALAGNR